MYVHVPAAWLSMMGYMVMAVSALGTLIWRHPLADVSIKAAAPIGAAFTFLALPPVRCGASRCGAHGGSGTRG
jgi:heme exporter protein C